MWKSFIYPRALPKFFGGLASGNAYQIDWISDTVKLAFLESSYSPSSTHELWADVSSHEVSDTDYTAGGVSLGSKTVSYNSTHKRVTLDAADTIFGIATTSITSGEDFRYGVLYDDTVTDDPLLGYIDFGSVIDNTGNAGGSEYGVQWSNQSQFGIFSFSTDLPYTQVRWYGKALANIFGGESGGEDRRTDWLSDDIRMMLCTSSYTPNLDTHETTADITNEVTGTGYTAGGELLTGKLITLSESLKRVSLGADNIIWSSASITGIRYGVFYNATSVDEPLLWLVDFGSSFSPSSEDFIVGTPGPIARLSCA